jgi:hypothetical protein
MEYERQLIINRFGFAGKFKDYKQFLFKYYKQILRQTRLPVGFKTIANIEPSVADWL